MVATSVASQTIEKNNRKRAEVSGHEFSRAENRKMNFGCPTLAASLFLRLGWDTTNLNRHYIKPLWQTVSERYTPPQPNPG